MKKEIYVGQFTEQDLKNGIDKLEVEKAKELHNLKYTNTQLVKKGKKIIAMKIWVCDLESFKL